MRRIYLALAVVAVIGAVSLPALAARAYWQTIYYYDANGGLVGTEDTLCSGGRPYLDGTRTDNFVVETGPCFPDDYWG